MLHNFPIQPGKEISDAFLAKGIRDFSSALIFVQDLPYRRNSLRNKPTVVLDELCGTCSTKHALIKRLADENGKEVKLMMGIYRMNASNTKGVKPVMEKYNLEYIPEAHNYLRMGNKVIDITKRGFANTLFLHDLLEEEEITPAQIGNYKLEKHQSYLQDWLRSNAGVPYSFHELWSIREECIAALSHE